MKDITVLAGIVTYNPEISRLRENIESIITQVKQVIVVDNGSSNIGDIKKIIKNFERTVLVELNENLGIATALNKIGEYAVQKEFDFFLTLDQDSVALPGLVAEYKKYLYLPNIGLLNSYQKDRNLQEQPTINTEVLENRTMRTSGSFMKTSTFKTGFKFDERLFIDKVDFDMDMSLIRAGFHLYQIPYYGLLHEVGEISYHKFFGKKIITYNHSSFRRYYISRNSILLIKKYGFSWTNLYFLLGDFGKIVKTLLFEQKKWEKNKASFKGIWDGIRFRISD